MTLEAMRAHITSMGQAFAIEVRFHNGRPDEGYAINFEASPQSTQASLKCILVPSITDETLYAVALHELGHLLHPLGQVHRLEGSRAFRATSQLSSARDCRLLYEAEAAAWEWAQHYAMTWTPLMDTVRVMALRAYRQSLLKKYGVAV